MKKTTYIIFLALLCISFKAPAQSWFSDVVTAADTVSAADTALSIQTPPMTYSSLMENIGISVIMSDSLTVAMNKQIEKNKTRKTTGYRVRIYFNNSRDARIISEQIVDTFKVHHPDIPVFRKYDNPYFKVTVGEFFSRADAMRFMEAIRREYPTVFLVKESFSTI